MDKILTELEKVLGAGRVRIDEPMSGHTTFKVGGPAQYYIEVSTIDDLVKAAQTAKKLKLAIFIFGGCSNVIIADHGIRGLVIKNNCRKFGILQMSGKVPARGGSAMGGKEKKIEVDKALVLAEGGVIMNQLVRFTIDQGLEGLEYQLGLPGTVGGGVYMNSNFPKENAYIGDCLYQAKLLTKDGKIKEVDKGYFKFAYDKSILQETGEIVLSVIFRFMPQDKKILWQRGTEALNYRSSTQPKGASAGCTFRNISIVDAVSVPTPGRITSAGYLIDKAGLKGKRLGDAMISDTHANFILNMGGARAKDIVGLVNLMKEEVYKKFGVHLVLEVKTVGF